MTPCVVFVPGTIGSVMKLNDEVVWPGSVLNAFITRYDKMDKLLDPATRPTDIIRKVFVFAQYQDLFEDLERIGFREAGATPTLFACPYDWRGRNEDAAKTLADVLDKAAALHPDAEVTLIGHSNGGLVSRYYLESGKFTARAGFSRVKRLITLGTPHLGATKALPVVLGMERQAFLAPDQVKLLADDPRYPAGYQLLPHEGQPFAWNADVNTRFAPVNIYDPAVANKLGLSLQNLAAAKAFQQALDATRSPVPYFCFVGTRQTTMSLCRINLAAASLESKVVRDESEDSGDGTVPTWSAGLHRTQALPVGGEHGTIYKNNELRRTLGTLLGKSGLLAPTRPDEVEVSLREKVIEPEKVMHASLAFLPRPALDGELRFARAVEDAQGTTFTPVGAPMRVSYRGLAHEKLGVVFKSPSLRGAYRASFFIDGNANAAGMDEFFVQS
jgi:pimeloyl-ACP methyl ester carboxylesterase